MITRLFRHIAASRPSARELAAGIVLWPLAVVGSVLAAMLLANHALAPAAPRIAGLFALGALPALPLSLWLLRISTFTHPLRLFSAALLVLSLITIGLTALVFAFDFWWYFAQWHGDRFSKLWLIQLGFTFASAIYQFLVSGLRLYVPFGVFALVAASVWLTRQTTR